jgi:hypothetical protein
MSPLRTWLLGAALAAAPAWANDLDADGFTVEQGDCEDNDPSRHPGARELCNGLDDDCSGTLFPSELDLDGDGMLLCGGDCDDTDPLRGPGLPERDNGLDDDCDGLIDEGTAWGDDDGDGWSERDGDCHDDDPSTYPGADEHEPDGIDQDCDGRVDEGSSDLDLDRDGWTVLAGDCDDANARVHPEAEPLLGLDAACDGEAVLPQGCDHAGVAGWWALAALLLRRRR